MLGSYLRTPAGNLLQINNNLLVLLKWSSKKVVSRSRTCGNPAALKTGLVSLRRGRMVQNCETESYCRNHTVFLALSDGFFPSKKGCFGPVAVTWGSVCPAKSSLHQDSWETHRRRSWSVPHRHTEGRPDRTETRPTATRNTQVHTVPIQHRISTMLLTRFPVTSAAAWLNLHKLIFPWSPLNADPAPSPSQWCSQSPSQLNPISVLWECFNSWGRAASGATVSRLSAASCIMCQTPWLNCSFLMLISSTKSIFNSLWWWQLFKNSCPC